MKVYVSDHALVRWLERVHGIDMDSFRAEVAELAAPLVEIKAHHGQVGGVWFILDGSKVVTVQNERPIARSYPKHDPGPSYVAPRQHWKHAKRKRPHT